mmetsp:Transcript_5251/g.7779  ORF Transcript_5251/g.7779 Transcript_5251/m.7779 type:complete len:631 (-) Transcript_5251:58-1950(-)
MSDDYVPPIYKQNGIIASFRGVPRFGHTNDISKLFSPESSDNIDYTLGTIFVGSFLFAVFVVWFIVLLVFIFLGKDRVGFLSGFPMKETVRVTAVSGGENNNANSNANNNHKKGFCRTPNIVRLTFVLSCVTIILMSIFSTYIFGLHDLKIALDDISDSAMELRTTAYDAQLSTNTLRTNGEYSGTIRSILLPDLAYPNFCVNAALDQATGLPFNQTRETVLNDLLALDDFHVQDIKMVQEDVLDEVKTRSENTIRFFNVYGVQQWQLLTYVITFCVIASVMMVATIFTWTGKVSKFFSCVSTWFLLPTLIVYVTIAWVVTSAISIAAVMGADFCTGGPMLEGPDLTTQYIIERSNIVEQSELLYNASTYWFNGCQTESPFAFIDDYKQMLNTSMTSMNTLQGMMESVTIQELERICGIIGDFDSIGLYFDRLKDNFEKIIAAANNTEEVLSCENINTIYVDAVHGSFCSDVPNAILWSFISLLTVSTLSMVIITFRSAWLEVLLSRSKMSDEMPIISIEKIQDLQDSRFNDSPSPKSGGGGGGGMGNRPTFDQGNRQDTSHFTDTDTSSREQSRDLSQQQQQQQEQFHQQQQDVNLEDPITLYQTISVADEGLKEIPSSPKDPPGYRVY